MPLSSLELKLNGGPNLLSSAQTLSSSDGGMNWTLTTNGLINSSGRYTLTLTTTGIVDVAGNLLSSAATPGGSLSTDVTLVLYAPSNIETAPLDVYETGNLTTSNTLLTSLATVDLDTVDTFVYSLVNGAGGPDNDRFTVVDNKLLLRTGQLLDFESQPFYDVRVQVSDSIGNTFSKTLRLHILNVMETLLLSGDSVNENAVAGRLVGNFSVADTNPAQRSATPSFRGLEAGTTTVSHSISMARCEPTRHSIMRASLVTRFEFVQQIRQVRRLSAV